MVKLLQAIGILRTQAPTSLEPNQERDATVMFLMCEAFERRYSPEVAQALRDAAQDIRRGRHLRPGHEPLPGD